MSYKTVKSDNKYDILEQSTNLIIELKYTETDARKLCRKLNLGYGFNGWTPSFIANKIS